MFSLKKQPPLVTPPSLLILGLCVSVSQFWSPGSDQPIMPRGSSLHILRKAEGPVYLLTARPDCLSPTLGCLGVDADLGAAWRWAPWAAGTSLAQRQVYCAWSQGGPGTGEEVPSPWDVMAFRAWPWAEWPPEMPGLGRAPRVTSLTSPIVV